MYTIPPDWTPPRYLSPSDEPRFQSWQQSGAASSSQPRIQSWQQGGMVACGSQPRAYRVPPSAAAPTFELSVEDYRALQRSANRGLRLSPSTSFDMIHNTPSLPPPGLSYFSGNIRPPVVPPLSRPSEIIRSSSIQYAAPLVQGWAPPVNVSPPVVIGWTPPAAVSPPVVIGWTPPTNLPLPLVMGWTPPIDIPQPVVPLPFNTPIGGDVGPCGLMSEGPMSRNGRTAASLFMAGRAPYVDPPHRQDLGRMDRECAHCGALFWCYERLSSSSQTSPVYTGCCNQGDIHLPPLEDPPIPIRNLFLTQEPIGVLFRSKLWQYNRMFSFTSLGVAQDHRYNAGRGPPVFRISGELHHYSGALSASAGRSERYAQLYVLAPERALDVRMLNNPTLDVEIASIIQAALDRHHQYVPVFRHAFQVLQHYDPQFDAQVRLRLQPGLDKRRYNLPTANEVAVILPENGATLPRDIVLRCRDGPLMRISDLHPAYAPLQYPLLFPNGENGWHPDIPITETESRRTQRNSRRETLRAARAARGLEVDSGDDWFAERRVSLIRYTAYRIHYRCNQLNQLMRGGQLFNRYVVDMYTSVDQQRLRWIELNQSVFRTARLNNLQDAIMADPDILDANEIGQRVFLPSSYVGGPRHMNQCYQDSMAIVRLYRKVDIFLTMTTNPQWPEIARELLPGQTAYDRPDLVARVFHMKKNLLLDYVNKYGCFGSSVAHVYTIEFQKRGLPHMHLLLFLDSPHKLLTPAAIDSCIWARWPDPVTQPLLFETVKKCMVHGPCGASNPSAPCMVNGKCSKGFPKPFSEFTTMDEHGFPKYCRPDDGRAYDVNGRMVDNSWIVPYPPFLLADFDCHINMECAVGVGAVRYIFKYIQKGPDRGGLEVEQKNEVKKWIDGRYISAPDATWRIFRFDTHHQEPSVTRLAIHLPGQQMVMFDPADDLQTIVDASIEKRTTLTAFFEANAGEGPLGDEARQLTYQDFPRLFVYSKNERKWTLRQRGRSIGRLYFIKPTMGELFYLRTLLTVAKGPRSFEDLRRVPGQPFLYPTFYAACLARGLLEDDGEWRICLQEACEMQTGRSLRHLFSTILLFNAPSQPEVLWTDFRLHICSDLNYRLRNMGIPEPSDTWVFDYGLYLLDKLLRASGHSLSDFPTMPQVQQNWAIFAENPLIAEQRAYNPAHELSEFERRFAGLNAGQLAAYQAIIGSIDSLSGDLYFLSGSGGTGKTFVYNTVCAQVRSRGDVILCVSSSGISALLMRGGRTAYSVFKIPIDGLDAYSFCNILKNSLRADLLREIVAIIWDEVGAQHRFAIDAVDRTIRDIRGIDRPFGGVTTVLGGDFLQTLPVVPHGLREDVVNSTIQRSLLWEHATILRLTENMRLDPTNPSAVAHAEWLLDVGNGRGINDSCELDLPPSMRVASERDLIETIYPGVNCNPPPPPDYFLDRMILAPRNVDVDATNETVLAKMHGPRQQYLSADTIIHEEGVDPVDQDAVPAEFLRSISSSGLPPGDLSLKPGCVVIVLRNLNPSKGLCNGTRLIVRKFGTRVIEASILGGDHNGNIVLIPRISLTPTTNCGVTFAFRRRQFPIRLAFALSINKSQGQSVRYVGIDLRSPVFSHGQLYVALSRATARDNIHILLPADQVECRTRNVVYPEVLL